MPDSYHTRYEEHGKDSQSPGSDNHDFARVSPHHMDERAKVHYPSLNREGDSPIWTWARATQAAKHGSAQDDCDDRSGAESPSSIRSASTDFDEDGVQEVLVDDYYLLVSKELPPSGGRPDGQSSIQSDVEQTAPNEDDPALGRQSLTESGHSSSSPREAASALEIGATEKRTEEKTLRRAAPTSSAGSGKPSTLMQLAMSKQLRSRWRKVPGPERQKSRYI